MILASNEGSILGSASTQFLEQCASGHRGRFTQRLSKTAVRQLRASRRTVEAA
jgi:hypothetical protein